MLLFGWLNDIWCVRKEKKLDTQSLTEDPFLGREWQCFSHFNVRLLFLFLPFFRLSPRPQGRPSTGFTPGVRGPGDAIHTRVYGRPWLMHCGRIHRPSCSPLKKKDPSYVRERGLKPSFPRLRQTSAPASARLCMTAAGCIKGNESVKQSSR